MTITADPRFDPVRNARERGATQVPLFYVADGAGAGTSDALLTVRPDLAAQLPWARIVIVLAALWLIWRLSKRA